MKFMSAVVILVLAVATQASVIPLAGWGNPWGTHVQVAAHPLALSHSTVVQANVADPWAHHASAWAPAHSHAVIAPVHLHGHAHSIVSPVHLHEHAVVAPVHAVHGHEASYVAANRGSVHVAPLPGHLTSQQSLNLSPAPGTW